ncbi:amidohydrolase family protein [Streptomyces sp. MS2.AVA.5]|uniref:Amidohydrolase family protein n=1 Tax=Streptomyces achmelvichensis TaxID=3134111 RepID=A0ACC6PLF1_9ACTN
MEGIIDSHHHIWDLSVRDQDWMLSPSMDALRRNFDLQEMTPQARSAGVCKTVLVQTVAIPEETPELLAVAADHALVAGVVGWTDLADPGVSETLARLRGLPGGELLVGVRHHVAREPGPEWLTRADVRQGMSALAEANIACELFALPHQLPWCTDAAAALPGVRFILDHLGMPPISTGEMEPWATNIRSFAKLPNSVCKVTSLATLASWDSWTTEIIRPYLDTVVDAFTPQRIMFGTDWPVCTLAASYSKATETIRQLTGHLTSQERIEIFSGTATRAYNLEAGILAD